MQYFGLKKNGSLQRSHDCMVLCQDGNRDIELNRVAAEVLSRCDGTKTKSLITLEVCNNGKVSIDDFE